MKTFGPENLRFSDFFIENCNYQRRVQFSAFNLSRSGPQSDESCSGNQILVYNIGKFGFEGENCRISGIFRDFLGKNGVEAAISRIPFPQSFKKLEDVTHFIIFKRSRILYAPSQALGTCVLNCNDLTSLACSLINTKKIERQNAMLEHLLFKHHKILLASAILSKLCFFDVEKFC